MQIKAALVRIRDLFQKHKTPTFWPVVSIIEVYFFASELKKMTFKK